MIFQHTLYKLQPAHLGKRPPKTMVGCHKRSKGMVQGHDSTHTHTHDPYVRSIPGIHTAIIAVTCAAGCPELTCEALKGNAGQFQPNRICQGNQRYNCISFKDLQREREREGESERYADWRLGFIADLARCCLMDAETGKLGRWRQGSVQ